MGEDRPLVRTYGIFRRSVKRLAEVQVAPLREAEEELFSISRSFARSSVCARARTRGIKASSRADIGEVSETLIFDLLIPRVPMKRDSAMENSLSSVAIETSPQTFLQRELVRERYTFIFTKISVSCVIRRFPTSSEFFSCSNSIRANLS